MISLSRSKIHISGLDKLPSNGRVLIVSNHTSNFDQIVMMKVLKISPIIFVTKPQNENIPIAGAFIHKAGFVTLDRGNDFNAARSISKCIKYIEDDLGHIAICPEGTRSKTGELLNFKAGSYKIAIKSEAPIVVLALSNCNQIHKNFFWKRTDVYFDIVDCLYYENYKSMNSFEIAEKTKNEIRLKLEQRKEESNNELYFI